MDLSHRPEPAKRRPVEPELWIEEVRLLESFSPEPKTWIRDPITFQKGLNIVWASAPPMSQRKEVNFAGHAAGKTTLCRLLRYLLGEAQIAAPGVKEAIEENFPNGWIAGKVHVSGEIWMVARPFHHATRPRWRCLPSNSFEALLDVTSDYLSGEEFRDALERATVAPLPVRLFGEDESPISFTHVLQWLARDQDCHLTKLHAFRHTDSKSDSPFLSAESAYFLQRTILNLADSDLQEAITACERLEKLEKALPADKDYLRRREAELNTSMEQAGIKKPDEPLITEILIPVARASATRLEEEVSKTVVGAIAIAEKSLAESRAKLLSLKEDLGKAKANVETHTSALKGAQTDVDSLKGKEINLEIEKEKARNLPPSLYCRVPRPVAEAAGCQAFCEWNAPSENEEAKADLLASFKREAERQLQLCQSNAASAATEQSRIEQDSRKLSSTISGIESKIEKLNQKLRDLRAPFQGIRDNINELERVLKRQSALESSETTLKDKVRRAKELQEELQSRHKKTESEFVDEFAWTVARIFGGKETATNCRFTREQISTSVTYHDKDLTSAAVTALQVFCFDLAALSFSCRGRGFHPRFLLHDSPREADMGEAPYGRLFDLIVEHATENPNFQHIITTTTSPPEEYQQTPYLRLKLESTESAGRLFCRDL